MGNVKLIVGLSAVVLVGVAGTQIIPPVLTNYVFQDELHDMASLAGPRIGLLPTRSEEELRGAIVLKAKEHGIELDPASVTVRKGDVSGGPLVYLEADYTVTVNLPGYSFDMRFAPSSEKKMF